MVIKPRALLNSGNQDISTHIVRSQTDLRLVLVLGSLFVAGVVMTMLGAEHKKLSKILAHFQ